MEMTVMSMLGQKDFYAKEFLLWLWYMIETQDGEFVTEDGIKLFVSIEGKMVLDNLIGDEQFLVKGEFPSESLEAHYALQQGKIIKEVNLRIVKGISGKLEDVQHEWSFVFKTDGFKISGLKLPIVDSKRFFEKFKERVFLLEEFYDYLQAIYKEFVMTRLDNEKWDTTFNDIKNWIFPKSE